MINIEEIIRRLEAESLRCFPGLEIMFDEKKTGADNASLVVIKKDEAAAEESLAAIITAFHNHFPYPDEKARNVGIKAAIEAYTGTSYPFRIELGSDGVEGVLHILHEAKTRIPTVSGFASTEVAVTHSA